MPVLQKNMYGLLRPVGCFPGLDLGTNLAQDVQDGVTGLLVFQLDPSILG